MEVAIVTAADRLPGLSAKWAELRPVVTVGEKLPRLSVNVKWGKLEPAVIAGDWIPKLSAKWAELEPVVTGDHVGGFPGSPTGTLGNLGL